MNFFNKNETHVYAIEFVFLDTEMGIVVFIILFLSGFALLNSISKKSGIERNWLWIGWVAKLIFSISFVFVFTYFYGNFGRIQGDAKNFVADSKIINNYAKVEPLGYIKLLVGINTDDSTLLHTHLAKTKIWSSGDNGDFINDNRLIIRINSVIHFFSFNNIYVHVLIFSMFAYIGLILIFLSFEKYIARKKFFFLVLLFLPSIGFWGSGLTKESLSILSLGIFFFSLTKLVTENFSFKLFFLFVLSLVPLFLNKPYVGLIIFPTAILLFIGKHMNWKITFLYVWTALIITCGIILSYTPPQINIVEKISYKQRDLINVGKGGIFFITDSSFCAFSYQYFQHFDTTANFVQVKQQTDGEYKLFGQKEFKPFTIEASESKYELYLVRAPSNSYFDVTEIDYIGINLLTSIPECLLNTTIRPFPTDAGSSLKYVSFTQNIFFLIFAIWVLFHRKITTNYEKYLIYIFLSSAFLILMLIGWTTPIFGAIVRYKVPADIFILISLFVLFKPRKSSQT